MTTFLGLASVTICKAEFLAMDFVAMTGNLLMGENALQVTAMARKIQEAAIILIVP